MKKSPYLIYRAYLCVKNLLIKIVLYENRRDFLEKIIMGDCGLMVDAGLSNDQGSKYTQPEQDP